MIMLRVIGMSILVGCAAAMLVWFGWGLVANLRALRPAAPAADEQAPSGGEAERA